MYCGKTGSSQTEFNQLGLLARQTFETSERNALVLIRSLLSQSSVEEKLREREVRREKDHSDDRHGQRQRDGHNETRDGRSETRNGRSETRDERSETRGGRSETGMHSIRSSVTFQGFHTTCRKVRATNYTDIARRFGNTTKRFALRSFSHLVVQSFIHLVIQSFSRLDVQPFSHLVIQSFSSVVLSYFCLSVPVSLFQSIYISFKCFGFQSHLVVQSFSS